MFAARIRTAQSQLFTAALAVMTSAMFIAASVAPGITA